MATRTHLERIQLFQNTLLTVFALLFVTFATQTNSWLNRHRVKEGDIPVDSERAASFRWHPLFFRILAVGQLPSAVDALLLRFLTDDVIVKIKDGKETEVFRVLDLATEIDPAFLSLYTAGSTFLSIVRNDLEGARKLLLKGERFLENDLDRYPISFKAEHWPLRWRINFNLGYLYLFELDDFARAMESYEKMGRYSDLPEALQMRTERVRTLAGQVNFALGSISVLKRLNADDPRILEELDLRRRIIQENQRLGQWNIDYRKFRGGAGKHLNSEAAFEKFRTLNGIPTVDALGGRIFLDENDRIDSKTRKVIAPEVMGLSPIEKAAAGG